MIPFFIGYDPREAAVFHVMEESIMRTSTVPVSFNPLHSPMLEGFDGQQDGTNAFIYSRFLVPHLMEYKGWAIYADSDMVFLEDVAKLWGLRNDNKAVMVVKHDYKTTQKVKFKGTQLESRNEDYPRKNWSSLILWNCGHPLNRILSREFVAEAGGRVLHRFSWLSDEQIGDIDHDWNHLVGEYPESISAKNVHFTLGAPGFQHYTKCDFSREWHDHLLNSLVMADTDPEDMVRRAKDAV